MPDPSGRLDALRAKWVAVEPPQRPVLLINPRSGDGKAARAGLAERARERGIETIVLEPDNDLDATVVETLDRGADALGMAGGDGSLAPVAAAAAERGVPFICIPAGTRNHFALDLGVARPDLVGALDAFGDGLERRVDMAEVNDRPFLNNVSLGVYGEAVGDPGYRDAKTRTILETFHAVLSSTTPGPGMAVTDDVGRTHDSPLVVLVSNNEYALEQPFVRGTRPRLDSGRLGVVVLDRTGLEHPVSGWNARTLEVSAPAPLPAGVDGESVMLLPPILFAARPAVLRVRISRNHPGVSPSGLLSARR